MTRSDLIHWYCLLRIQHSQYALSDPSHIIDKAREWVDKLLTLEPNMPDGGPSLKNPILLGVATTMKKKKAKE